jgi:hypothetical protein
MTSALSWEGAFTHQMQLVSPSSKLAGANTQVLANRGIRHTFLTSPFYSFTFELRAVSSVAFLVAHGTPPYALLRSF